MLAPNASIQDGPIQGTLFPRISDRVKPRFTRIVPDRVNIDTLHNTPYSHLRKRHAGTCFNFPFSHRRQKFFSSNSCLLSPSLLSQTKMSTQVQPPVQPEPSKCTPPAQRTSNSLNGTPTIHDTLAFQEPETPQTKWLYFKVLSAGFSFFVAGVNDGSLGSVIPYVMVSYKINTDMVSILYVQYLASEKFNVSLLTRPGMLARFSAGSSPPFLIVLLPSISIWV